MKRVASWAAALGFLALAGAGWRKPFSGDEFWYVLASDGFARTGLLRAGPMLGDAPFLFHPPLYTMLGGWAMRLPGDARTGRLVGILAALATLGLSARWAGRLSGGDFRARLAVFLLALNPAFIQGSLYMDIDQTLIPPLTLLLCAAALDKRWPVFAAALAACLWSKLTACVPLALALGAYAAWRGRREGWSYPAWTTAALSVGAALFALTFWGYCRVEGMPFAAPFRYLLESLAGKRSGTSAEYQALQSLLWIGAPLCALWGLAATEAAEGSEGDAGRLAAALSVICIAGYAFVGATPFGYPKYQMAALPFLCLLASGPAARALADVPGGAALWIPAAALGAAGLAALGDPLLTARFSLRQAQAAGAGLGPAAALTALQCAGPAAFCVLCRWWLGRRGLASGTAWAAALGIASLAQASAMDILQLRSYNTLLGYGGRGTLEAVKALRPLCAPGARMILPMELTGYLALDGCQLRQERDEVFGNEGLLLEALGDPATRAVAWGVPNNTVGQLRLLAGRKALGVLEAGWGGRPIGTYQVWVRR